MGRWTDVADWRGPIINSGDGDGRPNEPEDRMSGHVGVVIHTAEGTYAGTDSWQRNPAADVGSHFLTAKDGRVEQLIDTDDRSWCQSSGNSTWISIENEGFGSRGESLTAGQVEACARILARAHLVYGVPLQVSNSPSAPGLGWHGMGGTAWGGHYDCPGPAIKAQLPAIVARAAEIINGGDDMAFADDPMAEAMAWRMDALAAGSETVRGGPTKGEPMAIVRLVNALAGRLERVERAAGNGDAYDWAEWTEASKASVTGPDGKPFDVANKPLQRMQALEAAVIELRAQVMGSVDGASPATNTPAQG